VGKRKKDKSKKKKKAKESDEHTDTDKHLETDGQADTGPGYDQPAHPVEGLPVQVGTPVSDTGATTAATTVRGLAS
jgi:exopolyphosphatase/guanosine-5'-triphosphate,3'-diphosphate pyrophosphatase